MGVAGATPSAATAQCSGCRVPLQQWWATFFTTASRKRVAISVAGRTNNSSKGAHNIHPYYFFSSRGLAGCTRMQPVDRRSPTPALQLIQHAVSSDTMLYETL